MHPLAEQYQKTYQIEFGKLSKSFQDRILACKADNKILDPEVNDWIAAIIEQAEAKYDKKQQDLALVPPKTPPAAPPDNQLVMA